MGISARAFVTLANHVFLLFSTLCLLLRHLCQAVSIDRVQNLIKETNPTLSPALNRTWIDSWGRAEVVAIYRVYPSEMSGRTTDGVSSRMMRA